MPVDLERFTAAVEQLAVLREQGHLRIQVTPAGRIQLVFDAHGGPLAPEGGDGLYIDVEDVLAAIAAGVSSEEFARIRQGGQGILGPEDEVNAVAKYEMVLARLASGLQRRAWLRTTSKVYVLTSFDWEVASKLADSSTMPRPEDASETIYGLLRLDTERAGPGGQPDQRVTVVGLDHDNLDELIAGLTALRGRAWC